MRSKVFKKILATSLLTFLSSVLNLQGCTGIKLSAKDGNTVHGRTLEFGIPVHITIAVVPRNHDFQGLTTNGPGLAYKSKYAAVGCIAFDQIALMDGMNEKGLSVGTFYFPGYAKYTPTTPDNQSKSLSPVDFPNWILTQFATIDEVKAALSNVVISPTVIKEWGNTSAPFHYIVYEKSGKALVIEPEGSLSAHDNPLGVFTNSPNFEWHQTNLRNYINLTPYNVDEKKVDGLVLTAFGQGSGLFGLPGDFSPPSRFVRAALFSTTATPANTSYESVLQGFHILNNFDIPIGVAREKSGDSFSSDYTQFTCMRDPATLKYYFKSYDDQAISMVDFSKFKLDEENVMRWKASSTQSIIDVTTKLK